MKPITLRLALVCGLIAVDSAPLRANVTITSPTGGNNVSADKALNSTNGASFTALGNIVVAEGAATDFAAGNNQTLVLTAAAGWQFSPGVGTISFTGSRNITAATISVTASTATVTYSVNGTDKVDQLTIGGLQVQALDGANVPGAEYIRRLYTNPGTAVIAGMEVDFTTFGLLNQLAGAAKALVMQTQPGATATASALFSPQPEVKVVDQFGTLRELDNTTVVTATRAAGSGTLQGTLARSPAYGIVSYTNLSINLAGTITIQFTGSNVTSVTSDPIVVGPAPADHLVFGTQPASASVGGPFGIQPVIKTQDRFGSDSTAGLPPSKLVTMTLSSGTGALLGTTSLDIGTSAGNGIVSFTNLQLDVSGTNKQITASAGGMTNAVSAPFSVSAASFSGLQLLAPGETAAPGTPSGKTGTPNAQAAGEPFSVIVNAVDSNWNLVETISDNVGITSSAATATLPANAALVSGTRTFSVTLNSIGGATVTANDLTAPGKTANTSPTITVGSGPPRKLTIQTQPSATATAGVAFAQQPVIRVEDGGGNLVLADNGRVITAARASGTGTLQGTVTATTVNGIATFTNLFYSVAETITLDFTTSSLTNVTSASVVVGPAQAERLVFGTQPGGASRVGSPLAAQPVVQAQDRFGNASSVGLPANLDVSLALTGGSGALFGTTTLNLGTAGGNGVATFTDVQCSDAGTNKQITASAPGWTNAISAAFVVGGVGPWTGGGAISADTVGGAYTTLSGPAYYEAVSADVKTGTIILNAPAGFIFDTGGTAPTVLITRIVGSGSNNNNINSLASGTAAAVTSRTTNQITFTVTSASAAGVACALTWQNVRVRPTAGAPLANGNLTKTGTSAMQTVTNSITGFGTLSEAAGLACRLAFVTQPGLATAGAPFGLQPVLRTRDQFGNDSVTGLASSKTVNMVLSSGTGTLLGNTAVDIGTAAGNGVAAYMDLQINVGQTTKQLTASASGFTNAVSSSFTVMPAVASKLVIQTQPSPTATAGVQFAQQPLIWIADQFGNLRNFDNGMVVTAVRNAGSGTLQGAATASAVNGIVTFTNLSHTVATILTIDFAGAGLTGATSDNVVVSPAAASKLTIQTQPSSTASAGTPFLQQPVIRIEDQFGNLRSADSSTVVTATRSAGSGMLQGTTNRVAVNGVVSFADLSHSVVTNITILFTGGSLTSATSTAVAVGPALADRLVFITQPDNATAGSPFGIQPMIKTRDPFGNESVVGLPANLIVTVSLAAGSGVLQGTATGDIGMAGGNGTLTLADLRIDAAGTNQQLTASAPGLASGLSSVFTVNAAPPSRLTVQRQPSSTATAGTAFPTQPAIQIEDAFGNRVTSDNSTVVTATCNSGTAALQGTVSTTSASGLATFSNLSYNKAETIAIDFNAGSLTVATSSNITVTAGTATRLVIQTQPSSTAVAGVAFAQQPVIAIQDTYGNLRSTDNTTVVTAVLGTGTGTLQGTLSATAANGLASFANLSHTVANTISLLFSSSGLTNVTSANVVVGPGAFTQLQLLVPGESAAPGTPTGKSGTPGGQTVDNPFAVTVNAVDDYWNLVNTVTDTVGLSSSDTSATLPSNTALAAGTGSFNVTFNTQGTATLTASDLSDGTKSPSTSPAITVGAAQFTPATGGGAISADTTGGTFTSLTGPSYAENASGDVGTGTIILNPPSGFVFDTGGTAPTVLITRLTGSGSAANNINGVSSGTAVAMTSVSTTQLTFTVTRSSASGVSCNLTWQNVRVRPAAGTPLATGALRRTGTATVVGLSTNSNLGLLREIAGAANRLGLQRQPAASATAGVAFGQQPLLQVQDRFGNLCTNSSTAVTAARGAGSGTLQGTLMATATNGVASFVNLSHNVATNITLSFSASGLTGTNSSTIAISPAAADHLVFATQPGSSTYGSALSPQPALKTQDPFGNDSAVGLGASKLVSLTVSAGTGSLLGTASLDIGSGAGNGLVTFSGLQVSMAGASKQLSASASGLTNALSSTFSVSPATVSGSITANNKTYDGTTAATIATRSLSGILGSDNVSLSGGSAAFASKTAGTNKTVSVSGLSLSGTEAANYRLAAATATTTANITPRPLSVAAAGVNKVYNGTTSATVTLSDNRISGDSLTASYTAASFADKNVGTAKTVSVSGISVIGTDAPNYSANTTATATADITARVLTVTATGANKAYDGTTDATVTLADNRLSGDSLSTSYSAAAFATKNAGTNKTVSVTGISLTGTDSGNYTANTTATTTATISPRSLAVTAAGTTKVYDGTTTATVSLSDDRLAGDSLSATYSTATFASKSVGSNKTVSVSGISLSGADAANYSASTSATTTADIAVRSLTVSASGVNKAYDGTRSATVTLSDNRVAGDSLTTSYIAASFADPYVGAAKSVSVGGISVNGTDAPNYSANTTATTTANITTATVTALVGVSDKVYDGTTTATIASRSLTGAVGTDDVSLSGGTAAFASKTVGTNKTVTVTGLSLSGLDAPNYQLASTTAATNANITVRPLAVSAAGVNRVYNGTTSATVTLSDNRVPGDSLTNTYASATFADKNVGVAKTVTVSGIAISGADAPNYSANPTATTTADITARALAVSAAAANKTYDGNTTATVTLSDNRLSGDSLTASFATASFATKTVGTNRTVTVSGISLTGPDSANYTANTATNTAANITARGLSVAGLSAADKVYDGTTSATLNTTGATLSGVVSGDTVSLGATGATGSFADKNAGSNKTVTVAGLSLGDADSANYSLAQPTTTASISKAALTVTADDQTRAAGQPNPTLTASYSGFVGGETLATSGVSGSPALSATTTNLAGTYPISAAAGTLSALNYSFSFLDGTLTVTPGTANTLVILTQPSASATAGMPFAQQPVLAIQDAYGNRRSTDNSTVVTAARNAGTGTLQGTLSATALNGVVSFTDLSHNVANTINLLFSSSGLTNATSANVAVGPAAFTQLQLLVPGESAVPGAPTGKSGTPGGQTVDSPFAVTVNAVDNYWNLVNTVTDTVDLSSSDTSATLPPDTALAAGTGSFNVTLNTQGTATLTASDLSDGSKSLSTSPAITVSPAQFTAATGGGSISADTTGGTFTSLTGPSYAENNSGEVGTGTIILNAPAGFVFDTGGTAPTVLVTRLGGSGNSGNNINGVSSGTVLALSSVTTAQLTFTVTRSSASGVTCGLTWQNVRVRPAAGTPLAAGALRKSGTAIVVGLSTNSSLGTLRQVPGAASRLAVQTQPSTNATAGVAFAAQPSVQVQDRFGNLRSAANGTADNSTVVSTARGSGSGALQGTLTATATNGVASFSNLAHNIATNITLSFSASGLTGTNSAIVAVGPASADRLAFVAQPGNGTVGAPLPGQPILRSRDPFGNDSTIGLGASKNVSVTLTSGTGPLLGTTALDIGTGAGNGTVAFTDLGVGSAGTNLQLTASADGLSSATSGLFSINKNSQTITFDTIANKTYGDAPFSVSATTSSGLPVSFSIVSGPATIAGAVVTVTGAGAVTVRATQPGDDTWAAAAPVERSFTVARAILTVTAESKSRIYGASNPLLTASYSGFVNGENASALSGSPSLSTTATAASAVAGSPYSITVAKGTLAAANYDFVWVSGSLTITKAALTVTAIDQARTYGSTNPPFTASYSGFVNGEDASALSGSPSLSTTATPASPVAGGPYTITIAPGSLTAANYDCTFVNGSLTILPAFLTVTAQNASRVYGQTNPVFAGTLTGLQNSDNITASYDTAATATSPAGTYPILPSLADPDGHLANYSVAVTNGTLLVTVAQLVGSVGNNSRAYGQANPLFTVRYDGFLSGDDERVLSGEFMGTTTADQSSPVGTYPIRGGGQSATNYAVTYVDGTLTITPHGLSVVANSASRSYGEPNPALSGALTGLQNGDNITASYTTAATVQSAVGTYAIAPSLSDPDGKLGNYTVTANEGTLTVTRALLAVTADNAARPYGQENPAFSGALSGVRNNDNIIATYTTSATASSPAGTYDIVPGLSDPDSKLSNYTVSATRGTLTIGKVTLTVTADNQSRVYGAPDPTFTASYSGFVGGDNANVLTGSPALSTTASRTSPVAGSPYAITTTRGTLGAANYDFVFLAGQLAITPAASESLVASSANPSPTGSNITLTATLSGVAPSTGVPSGTVQFMADGSPLGTAVNLENGVASLSTAALSHGIHSINAQYAGDGNFYGRTNAISLNQVVNHLPAITPATYSRASNAWIQIGIPEFIANHASDVDGDALTLLSVSSGTNGATVLLFGGSIYYLPSQTTPNRDTTDHLDYAVTDGFPGGTVTNQIRIELQTPAPATPGVLTGITAGAPGIRLTFTGSAGSTYQVERAAALQGGGTAWTNIGAATTDNAGRGEFTDTNPPSGQAYYRTVSP